VRSVFVFVFALGQRQRAAIGDSSPVLELTEINCGAVSSFHRHCCLHSDRRDTDVTLRRDQGGGINGYEKHEKNELHETVLLVLFVLFVLGVFSAEPARNLRTDHRFLDG
jgi:hypothetical protein